MSTGVKIHPLFGRLEFKTQHPTWVFGDSITFTSGFDENDVTTLSIPQLVGIPADRFGNNPSNGNFRIHKRAHAQFLAVFAELENKGLMRHIKSCAGSYNPRLSRPTSGRLSKIPSEHSYGIAIDLNSDDGSNGGSVAPVAPVFESLGFAWGKHFSSPDPMHFEVRTFIDHPRPVLQKVTVVRNGVALDLGGVIYQGHAFVELAKAQNVFGLVRLGSGGATARLKKGSKGLSVKVVPLGEVEFAQLTLLSGLAEYSLTWDNASKTATLVGG